MFTGIVQELGILRNRISSGSALQLRFEAPIIAGGLRPGDSVACNGVCLTAEEVFSDGFSASAVPETLERSDLGSLKKGDPVNLEPALKAGDPLGGHFVQGHVDGVAIVTSARDISAAAGRELSIRIPADFSRYCVEKGSFTLEGVSLTIAAMEGEVLRFALVPHTLAHTNLAGASAGDKLNFEVDLLGKYAARLLAFGGSGESSPGADTFGAGPSAAFRMAAGAPGRTSLDVFQLEKWGYGV